MPRPGHMNSCLNVFVNALEHDKILGQNDRKISSFDMQSSNQG